MHWKSSTNSLNILNVLEAPPPTNSSKVLKELEVHQWIVRGFYIYQFDWPAIQPYDRLIFTFNDHDDRLVLKIICSAVNYTSPAKLFIYILFYLLEERAINFFMSLWDKNKMFL